MGEERLRGKRQVGRQKVQRRVELIQTIPLMLRGIRRRLESNPAHHNDFLELELPGA
jgi:hypothetical protein